MEHIYDKRFLDRYIAGECSRKEKEDFLAWLAHAHNREKHPWMKEIWDASLENETMILGAEQRILRKILDRISYEPAPAGQQRVIYPPDALPERGIWQRNLSLRYAAVILIILIPLYIHMLTTPKAPPPIRVSYVKKATGNGQRLSFRLGDGTRITLGPNSKLKYAVPFQDSTRSVTLKGEAFFNVKKDPNRPFTVMTGQVSTTVVGTSFNVFYDRDKSISKIALVTGMVRVEARDHSGRVKDFQLTPGEQLICRVDEDSFETIEFDPLAVTGWKDGIIYFKAAGIDEIVERLETWYGVNIEVSGNVGKIKKSDWTYSGKFKNQTLENVLRGIGYVKDFSFEIDDKKVKLMFN